MEKPKKEVAEGLDEILAEAEEVTVEAGASEKSMQTAINVFNRDPRKKAELRALPDRAAQEELIKDYARRIQMVEQLKNSEKAKTVLELLGTATGSAAGRV